MTQKRLALVIKNYPSPDDSQCSVEVAQLKIGQTFEVEKHGSLYNCWLPLKTNPRETFCLTMYPGRFKKYFRIFA